MSGTSQTAIRTTVAGVSINSEITRTDELEVAFRKTVAAGKSGTLTTRTDDNTGVVTLGSGHGITNSDTVSVFWEGGSRYGVDVTATDSTTVSIDLGAGANLPLAQTAVVVSKEELHALPFDSSKLAMLAVTCLTRAGVEFFNDSASSVVRYDLPAKEGRFWASEIGFDNPLGDADIATVTLANATTTAAEIRIGLLVSSD